jgi:hypothetical protein
MGRRAAWCGSTPLATGRVYARHLPRLLPSDRLRGLLNPRDQPRDNLAVTLVAIHALGVDELRQLHLDEATHTSQRNRRKNPRTCSTSDSGCSSAAKWPPCGSSSNQRRSVNRSSASRLDGRVMSRG